MSVCVQNVVKAPVSSFCQNFLSWIIIERKERKTVFSPGSLEWSASWWSLTWWWRFSQEKREALLVSLLLFILLYFFLRLNHSCLHVIHGHDHSQFLLQKEQPRSVRRKNRNESRSEKRSLTGVKHEIRHEVSMGRRREERQKEIPGNNETERKRIQANHVKANGSRPPVIFKGRGRWWFV